MSNTISISAAVDDVEALEAAACTFRVLADAAAPAPAQDCDASTIEHRSGHEVPDAPPATATDRDAEGLPWDARINGESKLKLKKEGTFKLIRGVDPLLVDRVKAELRAALAAGSEGVTVHNVDQQTAAQAPEPEAAPTPAPEPEAVKLYVINGKGYTHEALIAAKWSEAAIEELVVEYQEAAGVSIILTFPQILMKIAESKKLDEEVQAALSAVDLASVEMLGARPDLIAAFSEALFNE